MLPSVLHFCVSCNQCKFAAIHINDLKRHMEAKHEGIRYPCDQCEYLYIYAKYRFLVSFRCLWQISTFYTVLNAKICQTCVPDCDLPRSTGLFIFYNTITKTGIVVLAGKLYVDDVWLGAARRKIYSDNLKQLFTVVKMINNL